MWEPQPFTILRGSTACTVIFLPYPGIRLDGFKRRIKILAQDIRSPAEILTQDLPNLKEECCGPQGQET
jgi:hypothetical protein